MGNCRLNYQHFPVWNLGTESRARGFHSKTWELWSESLDSWLWTELSASLNSKRAEGEGQDGGRVRCGDHLPSHRYIRNTSTRGTAPTEHPLNAGRRHQTSQMARNSLTYLGRAKEKRNNRDKRIGTGPAPLGGSCEGGKVSTH